MRDKARELSVVSVRLERGLREQLEASARASRRALSCEIAYRIDQSLKQQPISQAA